MPQPDAQNPPTPGAVKATLAVSLATLAGTLASALFGYGPRLALAEREVERLGGEVREIRRQGDRIEDALKRIAPERPR